MLEKIIYKCLYSFLENNNILYKSQYGFQKLHLCSQAITDLLCETLKNMKQGKYTVGIFLDLSKAFDTLEHSILLKKLNKYGVRGTSFDWFSSYLSDREMKIKCQTACSNRITY